ncbi:MAG TPA: SPFH domain-containing protein [Gemmatales bacterium]|nr:SPFH domain-containing protein [Gemmatales bacterium]
MKRRLLFFIVVLIACWAVRSSILFVDAAEYVYVTQFGRPVCTYDGQSEAGLHWKLPWPVHSAARLDRRLQAFDIPTQEYLIRDRDESGLDKPLPITFDLFICWRIGAVTQQSDSEAVDRFVRSFGTIERAQQYLRTQVVSRLKMALGTVYLHDLINTDPGKVKIQELMQRVRKEPSGEQPSLEQLGQSVGVELVDVRLRRFNHPLLVRDEIYSKIREERRREAELYRNQGLEAAARIRAEGDLEARKLRAEAEASKTRLEGQADAEAIRLLNDAASAHPELYGIVKLLKSSQKMFADDKTQLILSLDHPLLTLFKTIPSLQGNSVTTSSPHGEKK